MQLFTKKSSRWDQLVRSAVRLATPARRVAAPALRMVSRPGVKAVAGVTGAAVAATAASAAASTARKGES